MKAKALLIDVLAFDAELDQCGIFSTSDEDLYEQLTGMFGEGTRVFLGKVECNHMYVYSYVPLFSIQYDAMIKNDEGEVIRLYDITD